MVKCAAGHSRGHAHSSASHARIQWLGQAYRNRATACMLTRKIIQRSGLRRMPCLVAPTGFWSCWGPHSKWLLVKAKMELVQITCETECRACNHWLINCAATSAPAVS